MRNSTNTQYPKAIVLSCVGSRISVEDVFVARVAENFVNKNILGSMELTRKLSGPKLILVMRHENCGTVKVAIDNVKLGNITLMLMKIKPTVASVNYKGEKNSKNKEYLHLVCESNIKNTIEQIRTKSPVLKEMEENNMIKIVGAIYNMDNGQVLFLN